MHPELAWPAIWREMRERLVAQPRCPQHPAYPHVRTISQGVVNDLVEIRRQGIRVGSHRTGHEDFIGANRFQDWWKHLIGRGSASLHPGDENNPQPWRSAIVGSILLAGLPEHLRFVQDDTIELVC